MKSQKYCKFDGVLVRTFWFWWIKNSTYGWTVNRFDDGRIDGVSSRNFLPGADHDAYSASEKTKTSEVKRHARTNTIEENNEQKKVTVKMRNTLTFFGLFDLFLIVVCFS